MVSSHSTAISWVRNRTVDKNSVSTNVPFSFFFKTVTLVLWIKTRIFMFHNFGARGPQIPNSLREGFWRRCAWSNSSKIPNNVTAKAAAPACAFRIPTVKQQNPQHICAISWHVSYSKQETTVNSPRQDLHNHTGQGAGAGSGEKNVSTCPKGDSAHVWYSKRLLQTGQQWFC